MDAVLVVGNTSSLAAADEQIKARLEAAGLTVSVQPASVSPSAQVVSDAAVAMVSPTADVSDTGWRAAMCPVGWYRWDNSRGAVLGLANNTAGSNGGSSVNIRLVDSTARPSPDPDLYAGKATSESYTAWTTTGGIRFWVDEQLAPDVFIVICESVNANRFSGFGLDEGDDDWDENPAPARRFQWADRLSKWPLASDGVDLLDAQIAWLVDAGPAPTFDPAGIDVVLDDRDVVVSWDLSSTPDVDAYQVFRRTPQTGEPFDPEEDTPVATVADDVDEWRDVQPAPGDYDYQVFGRIPDDD